MYLKNFRSVNFIITFWGYRNDLIFEPLHLKSVTISGKLPVRRKLGLLHFINYIIIHRWILCILTSFYYSLWITTFYYRILTNLKTLDDGRTERLQSLQDLHKPSVNSIRMCQTSRSLKRYSVFNQNGTEVVDTFYWKNFSIKNFDTKENTLKLS